MKAGGIALTSVVVAGLVNLALATLMLGHLNAFWIVVTGGQVVSFLIAASVYSLMLPTSFGKAVLVSIFQLFVVMVIAIVVGAVMYGIYLSTGP